jgi:hypothetical protein
MRFIPLLLLLSVALSCAANAEAQEEETVKLLSPAPELEDGPGIARDRPRDRGQLLRDRGQLLKLDILPQNAVPPRPFPPFSL